MSPHDPQTALSDGFGPALHDFADVVDIASLNNARRRHMRRRAMDAVDHLVALLDALDAATEDCEPDCEAEEDIPAEDDGTAEPSLGAPERSPFVETLTSEFYRPALGQSSWRGFASSAWNQVRWAQGQGLDEGEAEPGYDLPEGDDERDDDGLSLGEGCASDGGEPYLSVAEWDGMGDNWRRSGAQTFQGFSSDLEVEPLRLPAKRAPRDLDAFKPSAMDLATRARALKRGLAIPADGLPRPWLGAPRVFGCRVSGDCCAPYILDGSSVHVDQEVRPEAGDFVVVYFEAVREGRPIMLAWVKRLVMGLPAGLEWPFRPAPDNELLPVLMVQQLKPPRAFTLDVRRVHAVLKVVHVLPPAEAIAARARLGHPAHR